MGKEKECVWGGGVREAVLAAERVFMHNWEKLKSSGPCFNMTYCCACTSKHVQ